MSKGLEALKKIKNWLYTHDLQELCDIDIIEKELKALEIIKKKNVSISAFKLNVSLETYIIWWTTKREEWLTQEEFDLLKEIL